MSIETTRNTALTAEKRESLRIKFRLLNRIQLATMHVTVEEPDNAAAAERLKISPVCLRARLSRIYTKLDIEGRDDLNGLSLADIPPGFQYKQLPDDVKKLVDGIAKGLTFEAICRKRKKDAQGNPFPSIPEAFQEKLKSLTMIDLVTMRLILTGADNRTMANEFNITLDSVKHRIQSLFKKLNVKNRLALLRAFTIAGSAANECEEDSDASALFSKDECEEDQNADAHETDDPYRELSKTARKLVDGIREDLKIPAICKKYGINRLYVAGALREAISAYCVKSYPELVSALRGITARQSRPVESVTLSV
jgi:DNA-binding CsgD family transcriptional regulator